ncbi:MAG: glycosyltransferase family 4 protein [Thiotrichales bacterium]|nr:glycosyltransferase family 4 protein [Thiotrichales bacterium]
MKKILFIVNVDWFFVSHRLPIALEAKKQGYEVHIACKFTDKFDLLASHGFILHELNLERASIGLLNEVRLFVQIFRCLKKVNPDLLHAITIKPVLYAGFVSRFTQIKRVFSISGLGYVFIGSDLKSKLIAPIAKLFYRLAIGKKNDVVIVQNKNDHLLIAKMCKLNDDQFVLIPGSGVDLTKYHMQQEPENEVMIMFMSRLLKDKGIYEFYESASLLKNKDINARFVLVGDVDANPKSLKRSELVAWVASGVVEYWGHTNHPETMIPKCNIFVLPSYREGFPKALIEAAACGRPVVTTDVPGCRDAIIPDKTGILVPAKDPLSLANAIEKLILDKNLRESMGVEGRLLAESRYSIDDVVKTHLYIYSGLGN